MALARYLIHWLQNYSSLECTFWDLNGLSWSVFYVVVRKWQLLEFKTSLKIDLKLKIYHNRLTKRLSKGWNHNLTWERCSLIERCSFRHWKNTADLLVLRRSFRYHVRALLTTHFPPQHFNAILHLLTFSCVLLFLCTFLVLRFLPLPFVPILQFFLSFRIQWRK